MRFPRDVNGISMEFHDLVGKKWVISWDFVGFYERISWDKRAHKLDLLAGRWASLKMGTDLLYMILHDSTIVCLHSLAFADHGTFKAARGFIFDFHAEIRCVSAAQCPVGRRIALSFKAIRAWTRADLVSSDSSDRRVSSNGTVFLRPRVDMPRPGMPRRGE